MEVTSRDIKRREQIILKGCLMCCQAKACTRALLKGNEGDKEWKGKGLKRESREREQGKEIRHDT